MSLSASPVRVIVLLGFMGAGKTSVGMALAAGLGWDFDDLDDRIQAREGLNIQQIFENSGEAAFRKSEHEALRDLLTEIGPSTRVLALGGGAYAEANNRTLLDQPHIVSVLLDAPVDELYRRCEQQKLTRPLRRSQTQFQELYRARQECYATAKFKIDTQGKDIATVAAEVAEQVR